MVGSSRCTFIPQNDDMIQQALTNLTALRDAVDSDSVQKGDLFSWLTAGSWWQVLLKFLTPLFVGLILFSFLMICVFPYIRNIINRSIARSFLLIQVHLQQREQGTYVTLSHEDDNAYADCGTV